MNTTWQERKAQRQKETALEHAKYLNAKYAPTRDEWNAHWLREFNARIKDVEEGKLTTLGLFDEYCRSLHND